MSHSVSPSGDLTAEDVNLVQQQLFEPFNPEFSVENEVIMSDAFTEDLSKELPPPKRRCEQV